MGVRLSARWAVAVAGAIALQVSPLTSAPMIVDKGVFFDVESGLMTFSTFSGMSSTTRAVRERSLPSVLPVVGLTLGYMPTRYEGSDATLAFEIQWRRSYFFLLSERDIEAVMGSGFYLDWGAIGIRVAEDFDRFSPFLKASAGVYRPRSGSMGPSGAIGGGIGFNITREFSIKAQGESVSFWNRADDYRWLLALVGSASLQYIF